ncbi:MAG TPA: hypothetical protein VKU61_15920 [Candidatus Binatia bacterium]|nr:hypothetical protein [Candidatus Binatia bacterium]
MPEAEELDEADVDDLVRKIQAGEDEVAVPATMLEEQPVKPEARSLYAQIMTMAIAQKIKLALRGNQDARVILVRDSNKLIRRFVLMNPRIGENEIVAIVRNKSADDDLIRMITERRDWMRLYQVRLGLATNPKAQLPVALRLLGTLEERDIRQIAKSKNVPQAVAAHARRILFTKHAPK